ncbi:MAG: DUF1998 domain-containing protein, partial [Anaerolineae bacterium]|nr:DUF1998 domain-containing protein [Anaerolineae bacterium]
GIEYRKVGEFFDPLDRKPGPPLLTEFLEKRPREVWEALERILPKDEALRGELQFDDEWHWVARLTNPENSGVLDQATLEVSGELETFKQMMEEAAAAQQFKKAEYFKRVQNQLRTRDLLGFLGTHNVLPKYGFPTDVVELKTNHLVTIGVAKDIDLSRGLKIAISEFAPGAEVVAAKKVWRSVGVRRLPDKEWPPYGYAICEACHRFNYAPGKPPSTCACGASLEKAGHQGIFIVPENGFVAASDVRNPGESPPQRMYAGRVHFASYRLPGEQGNSPGSEVEPPMVLDRDFTVPVWKRYSRYGWLAVVNRGFGGGFGICSTCGYAEPVTFGQRRRKRSTHVNPLTGKECRGVMESRYLGHMFMTDVLEISFEVAFENQSEILSVLYALLEGASDALGISQNDIDGTFYYYSPAGESPSFVLFDSVPGGAGHTKRIFESLRPTVEAALSRMERCECGEDTSSYECLRNYRNQWAHDLLKRGAAMKVLREVLK